MSKKKKKFVLNIYLPFIIVGALTLVFALFKFTASEIDYVYVKIKVSQGFLVGLLCQAKYLVRPSDQKR